MIPATMMPNDASVNFASVSNCFLLKIKMSAITSERKITTPMVNWRLFIKTELALSFKKV